MPSSDLGVPQPPDSELVGRLLRIQDQRNALLAPNWALRDFAWTRAIYMRAAYLHERLGYWKFWRSPLPALAVSPAECRLELVNILSFALSSYIVRFAGPIDAPTLASTVARRFQEAGEAAGPVLSEFRPAPEWGALIDAVVARAASGGFDVRAFMALAHLMGAPFPRLGLLYLARATLCDLQRSFGISDGRSFASSASEAEHIEAVVDAAAWAGDADLMNGMCLAFARHFESPHGMRA